MTNDPKEKEAIEDAKRDFDAWVQQQEESDNEGGFLTSLPGV